MSISTIKTSDIGNDFVAKINANFLEIPSGGGSDNAISVKSAGAVGDGITDDTDILEQVFSAAYLNNKAVFFDAGTYLIRRSLTLRSGMEIYGYHATIKKQSAVTTTLAQATEDGQTYIDVVSAYGFKVGDQFFISTNASDGIGANGCTYGVITGIEDNRITFTSCLDSVKAGCVKAHAVGCKVSTSFAILRSWAPLYPCEGAYIHDITLDGNKNSYEAHEWSNSCIHIDADLGRSFTANGIVFNTIQRNTIIKNVIIKNSPYDGISDQGRGGAIIDGCRIEDCWASGVHFGTEYYSGKVVNCNISSCGKAGVFWCENVNDIIVAQCMIQSCNKGVSDVEFASPVKHSIICNNVFKSITSVVFDFSMAEVKGSSTYGHIVIANNIVERVKGVVANLVMLNYVSFTGNVICELDSIPSYIIRADRINVAVIANNVCPPATNYVDKDEATTLKEVNNSWNE